MARRRGRPGPGPLGAWLRKRARCGLWNGTVLTFLIAFFLLPPETSLVYAGKVTRDGDLRSLFRAVPQPSSATAPGASPLPHVSPRHCSSRWQWRAARQQRRQARRRCQRLKKSRCAAVMCRRQQAQKLPHIYPYN